MPKDFYQISLKIILKNKKREILILQAVNNGSYAGYYDLPGGRIDVNEFKVSLTEIIEREIEEEIGEIKFKLKRKPVAIGRHLIAKQYSSFKKDVRCFYLFFEATYISGKIKISKEHIGYKWINLDKIKLEDYFKSGILEGVKMYLKK